MWIAPKPELGDSFENQKVSISVNFKTETHTTSVLGTDGKTLVHSAMIR
jgi:hypothetical protein